MLVVPMRYDDAVVGVITLSKLGLHQFDDDDLRLLSILADQAATALESARNLARSRRLAGELRLLLDVSATSPRSLDPHQVANVLARHLATRHGRRRVRDHVLGPRRTAGSTRSAASRPLEAGELEPYYHARRLPADAPRPRRPGDARSSTPTTRTPTAAEVAPAARATGIRGLVMLPLSPRARRSGSSS